MNEILSEKSSSDGETNSRNHKRITTLWIPLLAVLADLIALEIAFIGSYVFRFYGPLAKWVPITKGLPKFSIYFMCSLVALLVWFLVFSRLGYYRWHWTRRISEIWQRVFNGVSLGMIILLAGIFFIRAVSYSRLVVGLVWASAIVMVFAERFLLHSILRKMFRRGKGGRRVAIFGQGLSADMLEKVMTSRPELGHRLVGWLAKDTQEREKQYLGSWDDVREVVQKHQIDVVMVVTEGDNRHVLAQGLTACEGLNVEFLYVPSISSVPHGHVKVTQLEGIPLLKMKGVAIQGWNAVVKRTFDIVFSLGALIMLSPLLLTVVLLVKLTSPGPLFYRQKRIGLDGIEFDCLKFRSMRVGAESKTGPVWATKGDARVTGIGKIIRRLSIDELPQLWNVLRGDMSIVGPRPERPHFVSQFREQIPGYVERHRVRSGLTGWAQVNGWRGDTSIEIRTQYDLYYVENWSLGFDLQIILRTFTEVFFGKNAY